jgi:ribosomal protein S18 acetylase RimI-like enzyme
MLVRETTLDSAITTPSRQLGGRRTEKGHNAGLNGDGLIVRVARLEDIPAVLELWALARSAHASTPDRPTDLRRLVAEMPGSLLVAEVRGSIVGALIAAWDGWRGNMYRLAVRDERRRQGVASGLVEAGERHLWQLGARRVTALVAHDDPIAATFWDAVGYPIDTVIGRRVRNL